MAQSKARIGIVLILLMAGCAAPPPRPTFPDIRFTDEPPIELNVARIEVRVAYQPPYRAPNVDQIFPVPPEHALENWAHDRLRAVGSTGRAVFTITNGSVVETDLPIQQGLVGALTTQPNERYDLAIAANLTVIDNTGATRSANDQETRSQSTLQGITPNDRDHIWYNMTVAAMTDFDHAMTSKINGSFGDFVH